MKRTPEELEALRAELEADERRARDETLRYYQAHAAREAPLPFPSLDPAEVLARLRRRG